MFMYDILPLSIYDNTSIVITKYIFLQTYYHTLFQCLEYRDRLSHCGLEILKLARPEVTIDPSKVYFNTDSAKDKGAKKKKCSLQ